MMVKKLGKNLAQLRKKGKEKKSWKDWVPEKFQRYLKKYDYNIEHVIGVRGLEKYILHFDSKVIRIYRGHTFRGEPLLCSYIPLEKAIFYSFELDKGAIEKAEDESEIRGMVETEVYGNAGIDETEEYIIKYKLVPHLKNEKKVGVESVIVPVTFIEMEYKDILEDAGYIDYLSFPAFSFASLYNEILQEANDAFVVVLEDKTFMAFYAGRELLTIKTLSEGLNDIYEEVGKLNIAGYNRDIFQKLLEKKGLDPKKYFGPEKLVYKKMDEAFGKLAGIIENTVADVVNNYNIPEIERIFITTRYGSVRGIEEYMKRQIANVGMVDSFEFYQKYNLDRLKVEPFLFLAMVETHYAYKEGDLTYNFSLYLRKPTLFFRPSGQLIGASVATVILMSIPLAILWGIGFFYGFRADQVNSEKYQLLSKQNIAKNQLDKVKKELEHILSLIEKYNSEIDINTALIEAVYKFKMKDIPVSVNLTDLAYYMNKTQVYLENISMEKGEYNLSVYAATRFNIPNLIQELRNAGFNVFTPEIAKDPERKRYTATLIVTDSNTPLNYQLTEKKGK
ncbi:MAG: hypothetical protein ABGW77_07055 [Campylobacterales bacterium]